MFLIQERPADQLKPAGWMDVGAGIVVIPNAGAGGQNGVGGMVSLRAYPFGRWYSHLKAPSAASAAIVDAKRAAAVTALAKADTAKAKAEAAANANVGTATTQAQEAADARNAADQAAADWASSMQSALGDFADNYAVQELNGYQHLGKRLSFFVGRSVGGFDAKVVDGDINAFGIAFDIAPEFSLVWGRAYYNQPAQTGVANVSRSATTFGVQINLNAFKTMRGLTGSM